MLLQRFIQAGRKVSKHINVIISEGELEIIYVTTLKASCLMIVCLLSLYRLLFDYELVKTSVFSVNL